MIKLFDRMIQTGIKPKEKSIPQGCFIEKDGQAFFVCGKEIICFKEHFSDKKQTVERLVEKVMRHERKKSA